jgi:hypothetical protein
MVQGCIQNQKLRNYVFLEGMYNDPYYPNFLVDKGKSILLTLCIQIEIRKPKGLQKLYELTHAATNQFNYLEDDFGKYGSEIETVAREVIALDFEYIAQSYGYKADVEELILTREW